SSFCSASSVSRIVRAPLKLQTTTETFGQRISVGKGLLARAALTAPKAGFGLRSRVVSPKPQSSIEYPLRYHSSVQEKITTPQHPELKMLLTCQSSTSACLPSPFLRLSSPTSVIRRGRSLLRLCSRAR